MVSTQMLADPDGAIAPWLPFWASRQLGTYAIDGTGTSDLVTGLLHATTVTVACLTAATAITGARLRLASWPSPVAGVE
jgi:hypothetical protein